MPLHVHLSEQPGENMACQMYYGCTPTGMLDEAGALGHNLTSIHATHLTEHDIELLGGTGTGACFCPTTERDLADGIGPGRALHDAGTPLSSVRTSTSSSTRSERTARHRDARAAGDQRTGPVHTLGPAPGGVVQRLSRARLVGRGHLSKGRSPTSSRCGPTRSTPPAPEQIIYSGVASDVSAVVVGGDLVVRDGQHRLGDVGRLLGTSIERVVSAAVGA